MRSISLGPVAIPVAPLLLLSSVWLASWVATAPWVRRPANAAPPSDADAVSHTIFAAAGLGLLAARLAYLASNAAPYLASPAAMLDLRDGGWHAGAGASTAAAWLVWRGWKTPPWRRPLALAAVAGSIVWSAGTLMFGGHEAAGLPTTTLATLAQGHPIDLRTAAAGRPVVINLWASWCGPCRQEMPALAAAQQRESTVAFVFVNEGESPETIQAYLATLGAPLHEVLLDAGSRLGPAVGSRGLPTTLFYDARGQLVDAHFGALNGAALESRLRAIRTSR